MDDEKSELTPIAVALDDIARLRHDFRQGIDRLNRIETTLRATCQHEWRVDHTFQEHRTVYTCTRCGSRR